MKSFCALFAVVLAATPALAQAPHIASTTPDQIVVTSFMASYLDLEIDGSGLIPPGATFQTVPVDVAVWGDGGKGWRKGQVIIPGLHGWGAGHLSIRIFDIWLAPPGLKIKVQVKGVDSNVYTVPVFNPAPSAPPKITFISPPETALGSSDYYFVLQVHTDGQMGKLFFNGQQITQYVDALKSVSDYYFQFTVPAAFRTGPGIYPVQVTNSKGSSPIVNWALVAPPTITSISPSHLTAAQVAPGAKPTSVTVNFGGSAPKTIAYAADAASSWTKATGAIVFGHQATFDINAGALNPKQKIIVKLSNIAGEATKAIDVQIALTPASPTFQIKK